MLVFAGDLHLTDGTSGTTIRAEAFKILRQHLRNPACAASWRDMAVYKPIAEAHVVLLGDVFDVIRSKAWFDAVKGCASSYDNIWFNKTYTSNKYAGRCGVYRYVEERLQGEDKAFAVAKATVSDHLPVWAEFRTDGLDDD